MKQFGSIPRPLAHSKPNLLLVYCDEGRLFYLFITFICHPFHSYSNYMLLPLHLNSKSTQCYTKCLGFIKMVSYAILMIVKKINSCSSNSLILFQDYIRKQVNQYSLDWIMLEKLLSCTCLKMTDWDNMSPHYIPVSQCFCFSFNVYLALLQKLRCALLTFMPPKSLWGRI